MKNAQPPAHTISSETNAYEKTVVIRERKVEEVYETRP
jgi:hypothetical protein